MRWVFWHGGCDGWVGSGHLCVALRSWVTCGCRLPTHCGHCPQRTQHPGFRLRERDTPEAGHGAWRPLYLKTDGFGYGQHVRENHGDRTQNHLFSGTIGLLRSRPPMRGGPRRAGATDRLLTTHRLNSNRLTTGVASHWLPASDGTMLPAMASAHLESSRTEAEKQRRDRLAREADAVTATGPGVTADRHNRTRSAPSDIDARRPIDNAPTKPWAGRPGPDR